MFVDRVIQAVCRAVMALEVAVFVALAIPHGWHAVAERGAFAATAWSIAESVGRLYLRHPIKRQPKRR